VRWNTVLIPLLAVAPVAAQQAIVNMPSADITPKGKSFAMHETQWRGWGPNGYWYGTHFLCYGIGGATELTLTNWNSGTPATSNFTTGIGFKSSPLIWKSRFEERELKLTVGQKFVASHRGQGPGSFSYAHLSFRLPKLNTRLTGGGWAGTKNLFKRNTGNVLAGLEQPLDSKGKWVWVNEWFRGRHDFGFYVTGLLFHPTKRHILVAAWKFPNVAVNGKPGIVLEYGIFF
jgi:hypothetical protein